MVSAGQRVPQGHVDRGERDTDQTLRPQQAEALGELLLDCERGECVPLHHRRDIPDQLRRRPEGRRRVGEHQAVTADAGVGDNVRQDQGGLRHHAAGRLVWFGHRHANRSDAELLNRRR